MKHNSSILSGKRVGVIAFNARPIASSLQRQGAQVFVSDYWGDTDLRENSSDCIAVLSPTPGLRQRQPLKVPLHRALVENYLVLTKDIEIDFVVIGSGFDDDSESLKGVAERSQLMGNSIRHIKRSRNHSVLDRFSKPLGLCRPKEYATTVDTILDHADDIGFPCVLRPLKSGGGSGIRLIRNRKHLEIFARKRMRKGVQIRIQEYITGIDISSSVLSSKDDARCFSVQGQLIGMPSAGSKCGFRYCGNYYPAIMPEDTRRLVAAASETLCRRLQLVGSNGFDFVVDMAGKAWLMEVNPRIQGTLEMLEIAGNLSVTNAHVLAIGGQLPRSEHILRPAVKMVVYSRKTGAVPDLNRYPGVVDRSPKGVVVQRGDPICTVIEVSNSLKEAYASVCRTASFIQNGVS